MVEPAPLRAECQSPAAMAVAGLARIALVLRHHGWRQRRGSSLTPTQGQILAALRSRPRQSVGELAAELGVTSATISDSLSALVAKGLARRARGSRHPRAVAAELTTEGRLMAESAAAPPAALLAAVEALEPTEQRALVRALTTVVRELQSRGEIPVARMCPSCVFFRPNVYADADRPHHCEFVDEPFGDGELRLDCRDHEPLEPRQATVVWAAFTRSPSEQEA